MLTEVEARPGLFLEELVNSRICALLPRQHPWCERNEGVPLEELDQQIMVLREPGSITRRTFDRACAEQGVQPRVLLELDSREAVTEVVSSLEVGNDPRVRAVPLVGPELTNRHLIGCLEKRRGLRVIRAFLELAAA